MAFFDAPVYTSLVFYAIDNSIQGHFCKQLLSPCFLFKGFLDFLLYNWKWFLCHAGELSPYTFKVVLWKYTPYATSQCWLVLCHMNCRSHESAISLHVVKEFLLQKEDSQVVLLRPREAFCNATAPLSCAKFSLGLPSSAMDGRKFWILHLPSKWLRFRLHHLKTVFTKSSISLLHEVLDVSDAHCSDIDRLEMVGETFCLSRFCLPCPRITPRSCFEALTEDLDFSCKR